ncbi:MAG TPA: glycosyltransferase, partial [Gemmatimonadales bacterium]
ARYEPQKDHTTLLHALGGLQNEAWELDLIGDGPLRLQTEALADSLGVRNRIHFLGQRKDVAQLLARAQISLLVSNWEGFPLSILESMRAGLPVVASNVGGVAESVQDDATGYLVPQAGVDQLRDRIGRLLRDPELRARLGTAGRRRFEQHFTLDEMVRKTLTVYQDVLGFPMPSGQSSQVFTGSPA